KQGVGLFVLKTRTYDRRQYGILQYVYLFTLQTTGSTPVVLRGFDTEYIPSGHAVETNIRVKVFDVVERGLIIDFVIIQRATDIPPSEETFGHSLFIEMGIVVRKNPGIEGPRV